MSISRWLNLLDFRTPPRQTFIGIWESFAGTVQSEHSLVSRFKPGTAGAVAERVRVGGIDGAREIDRAFFSSVRTRSSVWRGREGAIRLTASPGRDDIFLEPVIFASGG